MRLATKSTSILSLLLVLAAPALAQVNSEPVLGFLGVVEGTPDLAPAGGVPTPSAITVAYDNTVSPANFATSSTDLASQWGDRMFTTTAGLLSSHEFSIFNSGSSAGALLTAVVAVEFYDGVSAAFLGSYSANVNFGAGLAPGFYTLVNVPGLDGLAIILPTNVVAVQYVTSFTGGASRLGIASLDPPTVGSSPTSMYIASSTVGGGVPGYYSFATGPANPGYLVGIAQPPVGTKSDSWGQIKRLYR